MLRPPSQNIATPPTLVWTMPTVKVVGIETTSHEVRRHEATERKRFVKNKRSSRPRSVRRQPAKGMLDQNEEEERVRCRLEIYRCIWADHDRLSPTYSKPFSLQSCTSKWQKSRYTSFREIEQQPQESQSVYQKRKIGQKPIHARSCQR